MILVVSSSAVDCLERLVSEMTCYVSSGTLNPTHSLTHSPSQPDAYKKRIQLVKDLNILSELHDCVFHYLDLSSLLRICLHVLLAKHHHQEGNTAWKSPLHPGESK